MTCHLPHTFVFVMHQSTFKAADCRRYVARRGAKCQFEVCAAVAAIVFHAINEETSRSFI